MPQPTMYQGHHRIWHVLPGPDGRGRVKLSEPREDALWFDRRCFHSEDLLLSELGRRGMRQIPPVRWVDDTRPALQDFIEGEVLDKVAPRGTEVHERYVEQIMLRFHELAAIRPAGLMVKRRCDEHDRTEEADSAGFLRALIRFTHQRAYRDRLDDYGPLFAGLGIPPDALAPGSPSDREAGQLTRRPFCLLHGDLHRTNFIVDADKRLWTIDWELAMLGDPLYDLATHLYLMDYPPRQELEVAARWCRTVAEVLPGAEAGVGQDLPRYLAYKRAQSVYTDVVREAQKLSATHPDAYADQLRLAAKTVHAVLARAADVLRMTRVPSPGAIEQIYANR